jgi:predicted RNase H-like HicB family nuclease
MHRYGINIHWDDLDKVYIAEVPELPGCKAHGSTYEKAVVSAEEAIQLWIDTANEFGRKIPKRREAEPRKVSRRVSKTGIVDRRVAAGGRCKTEGSSSVPYRKGHKGKKEKYNE